LWFAIEFGDEICPSDVEDDTDNGENAGPSVRATATAHSLHSSAHARQSASAATELQSSSAKSAAAPASSSVHARPSRPSTSATTDVESSPPDMSTSDSEYFPTDDAQSYASKKRRVCTKRKWTTEELDCLDKAFKRHMLNGTQPGFAECQLAKDKFPCLQLRTLPQIKSRFIHMQHKAKS